MDKTRKDAATHEIKGTVKNIVGKLTGNHSKEAAGKAEQKLGKAEMHLGDAKDELKDAARKNR